MNPKSAQQKGKRFNDYINRQIEVAGLGRAVRTPGSGSGAIKGDVFSGLDFMIECKNQKKMNWWGDIDQAQKEATDGNFDPDKWSLVVRDPRFPEFEKVYVLFDFWQWLELLKRSKEPIIKEPDRQVRWKIKTAIQVLKELLKEFEE
jgi:hypothetical protein